jgi:hypothetical protein
VLLKIQIYDLKTNCLTYILQSLEKFRYRSVGIVLGYGLEDRGSKVRFPAGAGNFSLHHRVQNDSGAHPVVTTGSFSGGKVAGA